MKSRKLTKHRLWISIDHHWLRSTFAVPHSDGNIATVIFFCFRWWWKLLETSTVGGAVAMGGGGEGAVAPKCVGLQPLNRLAKINFIFLASPSTVSADHQACPRQVNILRRVPGTSGVIVSIVLPGGVARVDGARAKKQVWCPHVWTLGLSVANVLHWRKILWHCWDFSASPIMVRRAGNCAPLAYPRYVRGCYPSPYPGGRNFLAAKFFAPLKKCVGHSLKLLDIVQKIWAPHRKLFDPPVSQAVYASGCYQ